MANQVGAASLVAHDFLPGCNDRRDRLGKLEKGRRQVADLSCESERMQSGRRDGSRLDGETCVTRRSGRDMRWTKARAWAATGLLALAGLLSGCDARQWPLAEYQSGKPAARAWMEPQATPAPRKPAKSAHSPKGVETASVAMPGPVGSPAAESLIGLDIEQARDRLGPPHEEVEQAPAKLWLYRTAQCSLDVALYPDVQTHVFRVLNYEVKGNDGTEQGRRQCIDSLRTGSRRR
jgi:hypothetical protein